MIVESDSVGGAWLGALEQIVLHTGKEVSPIILKINNHSADSNEDDDLISEIDGFLEKHEATKIEATSGTIFPQSLDGSGLSIFDRYENIWKYVKTEPKNKRGTYFRRLSAYGEKRGQKVNQLKHIIDTYNGTDSRGAVHRRSALIATTFDPHLDHLSTPLLGFPCLQQVCFKPSVADQNMSMNAIYAMQHLDMRGYGNYLGLMRLGRFMARNMNLNFTHLNCMISVLKLDKMSKTRAGELVEKYGE